jgi:hypothetical protein
MSVPKLWTQSLQFVHDMPHWKLTALSKAAKHLKGGISNGCDLPLDERLQVKLGRGVLGVGAIQLPSTDEWLRISAVHVSLHFESDQVLRKKAKIASKLAGRLCSDHQSKGTWAKSLNV